MSDDGLSYSVAADFDKQLGQALAEIEARTDSPRFVPGARVENPDSPDILRRELLDPILAGQGMPTSASGATSRAQQPRLFETGGAIVQVDPITGQARPVYSAPEKKVEMSPRQRLEYSDLLQQRRTIQGDPTKATLNKDKLKILDDQIANYFSPVTNRTAGVAAPADLLQPSGFIGTPGGTNAFSGPAIATSPVRPGQVGRGRQLTRELAAQFREQARGDKDLARRLAREAGYEF